MHCFKKKNKKKREEIIYKYSSSSSKFKPIVLLVRILCVLFLCSMTWLCFVPSFFHVIELICCSRFPQEGPHVFHQIIQVEYPINCVPST